MSLTIEDSETDRLARQLAQLTGETITEAVARSVRERLARERRRRGQGINKDAVMTIIRRIEALPALDDRSADDFIGYDEQGTDGADDGYRHLGATCCRLA